MSNDAGRQPLVVVHPDADTLAEAVAARLLTSLLEAQCDHHPVHVALTGGTIGIASLAAVDRSPLRDAVDWSGVHLWWSDERFLPAGDPERNEVQASHALLDHLDALPSAQIHRVPARDSVTATPEAAAAAYTTDLARWAAPGGVTPAYDVLLLGMGPDGHIASLFPGRPQLDLGAAKAVAVHDSPKPPPDRVSFTYPAILAAKQVWIVASGAAKARVVARALGGADRHEVPAAGVCGTERTLWLLDAEAAGCTPTNRR